MKRNKTITIIIVVIVVFLIGVALVISYKRNFYRPRSIVNSTAMVSSQNLDAVPAPLNSLLDFSGVKPYGIKRDILANGSLQDTVQFNTSHPFADYVIIISQMTKEDKFIPRMVSPFSKTFKMVFAKVGALVVNVSASQDPTNAKEPNIITIVFNHPGNI